MGKKKRKVRRIPRGGKKYEWYGEKNLNRNLSPLQQKKRQHKAVKMSPIKKAVRRFFGWSIN